MNFIFTGCERMQLRKHLGQTLQWLAEERVTTAIATRNCREAYDFFLDRVKLEIVDHIFEPVLTRDSLGGVNKPHPMVKVSLLIYTYCVISMFK